MGDSRRHQAFLLDCFADCLVGKLAKGVVHNLNSPLQVLSMQLEMMKMDLGGQERLVQALKGRSGQDHDSSEKFEEMERGLDKEKERLGKIENVLCRLQAMVGLIGSRSAGDYDDAASPLILNQMLEEEVEFWKSDLFFKHQVEKKLDLPSQPLLITVNEALLRDMVDGIIGASIEQLRDVKGASIEIRLSNDGKDKWALEIEHSGHDFPESRQTRSEKGAGGCAVVEKGCHITVDLALELARDRARQIGCSFELHPRLIRCYKG